MYITIDQTDYTAIKNLSFSPSADLAGVSIPSNELQVDVITDDEFGLSDTVELYDNLDQLWATYHITHVGRVDADTIRIKAQDDIAMLDRITLPAVYHNSVLVPDLLDDTIITESGGVSAPWPYYLDPSFNNAVIHGFFPEQSARERLLWVCFTIGAYVKTCFNDQIEILALDDTPATIPIADTYWKPTINYKDPVTSIRVKEYDFAQGTPGATDKYVTDENGVVYIVTETETILYNSDAPAGALANEVTIEGVYTVNADNAAALLTRLAGWYFNRTEVDFEAIDNRSYLPGDKVIMYADEDKMLTGYIDSASFSFGLQAKARLHLTGGADVEAAKLIVTCTWNGVQVDKREYLLPVGYEYSIANRYIDMTMDGHRYILRPTAAAVTGTMVAGGVSVTQEYAEALDLRDGVLRITNVDEITVENGTGAIS